MGFTLCQSAADWNSRVSCLPHAHILQSWEWGEFKGRYGWRARRLVWEGGRAAAQVLVRAVGGWRAMYVPRGPLLDWQDPALRNQVLEDLQSLARGERALFIKIDPDLESGSFPRHPREKQAWRYSPDQIQFRNTVVLDLRQSEQTILAGMKQKTRYNIRLAGRKGVHIRRGTPADLDLLYRMYAETAIRDNFVIRSSEYYRDAWGSFMAAGLAQPFIAEVEGQAASALVLFKFSKTAWYMYGMSREAYRDRMPNHLLQWDAMRWAKEQGCETYDFWGAPDEFAETDPMWGVWKFKEGFGGRIVSHIGAWDFAPSVTLYQMYTTILPRVLDIMRWVGRRETKTSIE
jgi:peptidoglycan pentaglycine glycine transferase (the first glycine)